MAQKEDSGCLKTVGVVVAIAAGIVGIIQGVKNLTPDKEKELLEAASIQVKDAVWARYTLADFQTSGHAPGTFLELVIQNTGKHDAVEVLGVLDDKIPKALLLEAFDHMRFPVILPSEVRKADWSIEQQPSPYRGSIIWKDRITGKPGKVNWCFALQWGGGLRPC
jgi:hypothetical protein